MAIVPVRNMRIKRLQNTRNPFSRRYEGSAYSGREQNPIKALSFDPTDVSVLAPTIDTGGNNSVSETFTWSLYPFWGDGRIVQDNVPVDIQNLEVHFTSDGPDIPNVSGWAKVMTAEVQPGSGPPPISEVYNFAKQLNALAENHYLAYNTTVNIEDQPDATRDALMELLAPLQTAAALGSVNPADSHPAVVRFLENIFAPIDDTPTWPYGWRRTFSTDCHPVPGGIECIEVVNTSALRNDYLCSIFGPSEDRQNCREAGREVATWHRIPQGEMPRYFDLTSVDATGYTDQRTPRLGNLSPSRWSGINHLDRTSQPTTVPIARRWLSHDQGRGAIPGFFEIMTVVPVGEIYTQPLTEGVDPRSMWSETILLDQQRRLGSPGGPPPGGDPWAPFQSLLEIVYALMGSTGDTLADWSAQKGILEKRHGTVTPAKIYQALSDALQATGVISGTLTYELSKVTAASWYTSEHYNFNPQSHFALDYQSYFYLTDLMNEPGNLSGSRGLASIEPQYNYYNKEYETAIAGSNVPEAVLPNMYIYSFVTDGIDRQDGDRFQGDPLWNDPADADQLMNGMDRLITLDEFDRVSLPLLTGAFRGIFNNYLDNYARAVTPTEGDPDRTGVTIEFMSDLAKDYYNITTPAGELDIYERLNSRKYAFPMYIESSFPTVPPGPTSRLIEQTTTSTAFVDSYIRSVPTPEMLALACNGFVRQDQGVSPSEPARVLSAYGQGENLEEPGSFTSTAQLQPVEVLDTLKVFSFDEWFEQLESRQEAEPEVQEVGQRFDGQCPDLMEAIALEAIRNRIMSTARSAMLTFQDVMRERIDCASETILYKLTKSSVPTDDGNPPKILQNYFFPVSSRTNLVKFVDTQVKYSKLYRYELSAVSVVYGSTFNLMATDQVGFAPRTDAERDRFAADPRRYMVVNAVTTPNIKIVEYPLFSRLWENVSAGGLSYPPVRVYDRPPPPPSVLVAPLLGNYRQIVFALHGGEESFLGPRAIPWIMLNPQTDWPGYMRESILWQKKFKNFTLGAPDLEFMGESSPEIEKMEIYRSTTIDVTATSTRELYSNTFEDKLHATLDISGDDDVPEEDRAISFEYLDTMEPNVIYYYTCRAVDVHGKASNPTPIYVVELVYQKGSYYPMISTYNHEPVSNKAPTKKMTRFLEIKAANIQSAVKNTFNRQDEVISSEKGFITNDDQVENGKFLVRLTSRDTGRKIQFGINFKRGMTEE